MEDANLRDRLFAWLSFAASPPRAAGIALPSKRAVPVGVLPVIQIVRQVL